MSAGRNALATLVCVAGAAGIAACDGIGEGSRPTGVFIRYDSADNSVQTFECASFQLAGLVQNEGNGQVTVGDVTYRGKWRSSNPGVIDISNGDLEMEAHSGLYLPPGTVVARRAGSATIQFEYLGLLATFAISADPIGDLKLTPEIEYIAPGSYQTFALEAESENGTQSTDISGSAQWRIVSGTVPVSLQGTTVQTQSDPVGQPFTLEAQLYACDRAAQRHLTIAAIENLRFVHEQAAGVPVPVGYSDAFRIEADLNGTGGVVQNLTEQVTIRQVVGDVDEAELTREGDTFVVTGRKAGFPVQYLVRYEPLDLELTSRVITFENLELQQLRVAPETVTLQYPDTFRFDALGLFSDGQERSVRRSVTWTSLDTELLAIVGSGGDGGKVAARGLEGRVEITATKDNSEGELSAEAEVDIEVP